MCSTPRKRRYQRDQKHSCALLHKSSSFVELAVGWGDLETAQASTTSPAMRPSKLPERSWLLRRNRSQVWYTEEVTGAPFPAESFVYLLFDNKIIWSVEDSCVLTGPALSHKKYAMYETRIASSVALSSLSPRRTCQTSSIFIHTVPVNQEQTFR